MGVVGGRLERERLYVYTWLTCFTVEQKLAQHCKAAMCVLVAQLCPTLRDPMDCGPPGSSVHEILQARILEWVAISSSRGSFQPRDQTSISCLHLLHWQVDSFTT